MVAAEDVLGAALQQLSGAMNGRTINKAPSANWQSGRNCLINKNLDTLVMQVKASTILSEGLPYDRSSLAVITSLGAMEGLEEWDILTKEQHFNVMRTVIDLVLASGRIGTARRGYPQRWVALAMQNAVNALTTHSGNDIAQTIDRTARLTAYLMRAYGVPEFRIVGHFALRVALVPGSIGVNVAAMLSVSASPSLRRSSET